MKYIIPTLVLFLFSCHEEASISGPSSNQIVGNWLVIEETSKSDNITRSGNEGIVTTWNGLSYIGAIKIREDQTVKLNSFDSSYGAGDTIGTWIMNENTSMVTFDVQSFSKEFTIRIEDDFLVLESPTHVIRHRKID